MSFLLAGQLHKISDDPNYPLPPFLTSKYGIPYGHFQPPKWLSTCRSHRGLKSCKLFILMIGHLLYNKKTVLTYIHTYLHTYIHTMHYIHTHTHTHTHKITYIRLLTYIHTYNALHTPTPKITYIRLLTYIHTTHYIHTHTQDLHRYKTLHRHTQTHSITYIHI